MSTVIVSAHSRRRLDPVCLKLSFSLGFDKIEAFLKPVALSADISALAVF
jgi:hypothetical protein